MRCSQCGADLTARPELGTCPACGAELAQWPPGPTPLTLARPWGFWATIGLSAAVFAVFLALQVGVVVAFLLAMTPGEPGAGRPELLAGLESNGLCVSVSTLVTNPCCLALVVLFASLRPRYPARQYLGLRMPPRREVARWLLATTAFMVCSDGLTHLLGCPIVPEWMVSVYETTNYKPLLYLALIGIAPIFEEVFFRGFLIPGIRHSSLGATGAVLLSALAWAAIHVQYDLYGMLTIFLSGVLFGVARLATGSTYVAILMHALENLVATSELLIKVHVPS
jgi:membrane protease YdiL (CAAX protease family)